MKNYLYRHGDGNEGNFPRYVVTLADNECPYRALESLVLNMYHPGPVRDYIKANLQTEGEADYGVSTAVYEGPEGEMAFDAAWMTAELEPADDSDMKRFDVWTLAEALAL